MSHHKVIGVLSPWLGSFISSPHGIYGAAERHGYRVLSIKATPRGIRPSSLASAQVDGWLAAIDLDGVEWLVARGVPLVTTFAAVAGCPAVLIDNRGGMAALVSHLIGHGHTRIAFISYLAVDDGQRRLEGYRDALAAHGIAFDEALVVGVDDFTSHDGRAGLRELLARGVPFTAVAAASDTLAFGALDELAAAGLHVPHDVAVTGFDDISKAQYANPPLTTVSQPFNELGRVAADLLLDQLSSKAVAPTTTYVPSRLVVRQSCGCGERVVPALPAGHAAPGWRERLAREMAALALHPLPAEHAPPQLWDDVRALTEALEAATGGLQAPGFAVDAWRRSPLLTQMMDALLGLVAMLEEAGYALVAPDDVAAQRRVGEFITGVRSAALHAHRARDLEHVAYLKRQVQTSHSLSLALLGGRSDEVERLAWLQLTQVRWDCLALWAGEDEHDALVIAGSYSRDGTTIPVGETYPAAAFPPTALLPAASQQPPHDLVTLFPIRSPSRNWGVLAICAPADEQMVDEDKNMDVFAAMICAGLERETLLASLMNQQQLLHVQKMESVGRLAGGVAHDFNNMLTVISGYADMARSAIEPSAPAHSDLDEIVKATDRAASLTRQLLAFARKQLIEPTPCNLNELLTDTAARLRSLVGARVELALRLAPDLWTTRADTAQIEQVVSNLAANARDAMPAGGRLSIATANSPNGDFVLLTVSDTGEGIAAEAIPHLFEPFFTTKEQGRGTGLGLATCYGIVQQHGGEIAVESALGQGSTFTVTLPAVHERPRPRPSPSAETLLRGSETLLLAEDEAAVRALAVRILRSHGYNVLEAADGAAALEVAARYPGQIDLLLTDVVMPRLGGPELAARLLSERPTLPVVYMSGYTDGGVAPDAHLIQKPFAPDALLRAVRAALDAVI